MDNTQVPLSQPQTLTFRLLRRTALSLLAMSLSYAALAHATTASAFGQATGTATTETTGASSTDGLIRPTLKPGSKGAEVTELQATLKLLGYYIGTVDGVYGQTTIAAVSQFQQAAGLNADGIAGPATWNRLFPAAGETADATPTASTPATNNPASLPSSSGSASFPTPSGISPAPARVTPAANPQVPAKPSSGTTPSKPSKPTTETPPAAPTNPATASVALPVLRQGMKGTAVVALQERLRSLGVFKGAADGVFGAETAIAVKAAQRRFKLEPDGVVGGGTWSALLR